MHVYQKFQGYWSCWVCALGLTVFSCGLDNSLEGSIDEDFSLAFDAVTANRFGCQILLSYQRNGMLGPVYPALVQMNLESVDIQPGKPIFDEDADIGFLDVVKLTRQDVFGGAYPKIVDGQLTLERRKTEPGDKFEGTFEVTFEDEHDLRGTFKVPLTEPNPTLTCEDEDDT